jgi:hypothetical protein
MSSPVRITSPSAAAAFVLVDLLAEHGATATLRPGEEWEIAIPLDHVGNATLSAMVSAASDWLEQCGLASTAIVIDGHTHVVRGRRPESVLR